MNQSQIFTGKNKIRQIPYHYSQMAWLNSTYLVDFENHFLQNFPYSLHKGVRKKEKVDSAIEVNILAEVAVQGGLQ